MPYRLATCASLAEGEGIEPPQPEMVITVFKTDKHASLATLHCWTNTNNAKSASCNDGQYV